jgi:hypothetical protein
MFHPRIPAMRNQALIGASMLVLGLWAAWQIGGKIAGGDLESLLFATLGFGACAVAVAILRNWRSGFYLFLVWLLFEDLARKYLGNGTALFFGKDILVGLVYVSFFVALRRRREKVPRPPFLLPLALFVWLAAAQVFNPNSPSVLYGLLGFKLYFYYVPLMFVGYAFVQNEEVLRKFLVVNGLLAGVISALGIIQAIQGNSFLNPTHLAPELEDLGNLYKTSPLTGRLVSLPDSVFVSAGRYGLYLIFAAILMMGAAGYLESKSDFRRYRVGGRGRTPKWFAGRGYVFTCECFSAELGICLGCSMAPSRGASNSEGYSPCNQRRGSGASGNHGDLSRGGWVARRALCGNTLAEQYCIRSQQSELGLPDRQPPIGL